MRALISFEKFLSLHTAFHINNTFIDFLSAFYIILITFSCAGTASFSKNSRRFPLAGRRRPPRFHARVIAIGRRKWRLMTRSPISTKRESHFGASVMMLTRAPHMKANLISISLLHFHNTKAPAAYFSER